MKSVLLALVIVLFSATADAEFIRGPFSGKVIDAETKEPIEGAVVVVKWNKRVITGSPGGPATFLQEVKETLTNKDGEFYIEEYHGFTINPLAKIKNPEFLIFKPGYCAFPTTFVFIPACHEMKPKENYYEALVKGGTLIELPKLKTRDDRIKAKPGPFGQKKGDWEKQKLLIKAIREEWQYLTGKDPSKLYRWEDD
jgi:hypothetical protein